MYLSSIESRATTPVGCHRNAERVKASAQTMGSRDDAQGKAQFNLGIRAIGGTGNCEGEAAVAVYLDVGARREEANEALCTPARVNAPRGRPLQRSMAPGASSRTKRCALRSSVGKQDEAMLAPTRSCECPSEETVGRAALDPSRSIPGVGT